MYVRQRLLPVYSVKVHWTTEINNTIYIIAHLFRISNWYSSLITSNSLTTSIQGGMVWLHRRTNELKPNFEQLLQNLG